ncbi:hypothetical protein BDV95DRAFT_582280 [Massariosphaeria phaeospora]|uniref:Uncharacterized protein n=1 Tax=Massariosphaeria phaeospora TaxID=100035 RepID=A0A7C8M3W9_9PLEO|nr:hypothetical protein BDV95DRAFT_582280 [Massariosphaeria phaeospora]
MLNNYFLAALALTSATFASPIVKRQGSASFTPHDSFQGQGVLGCKIDINRVTYFPSYDNLNYCVKASSKGRSVHLLQVGWSASELHEMSWDAWNYLNSGKSAYDYPTYGGGIPGTWEKVPNEECKDLIKTSDGAFPVQYTEVPTYLALKAAGAPAHLYNFWDPQCNNGIDEVCKLPDFAGANMAECPSGPASKTAFAGHIQDLKIPIDFSKLPAE